MPKTVYELDIDKIIRELEDTDTNFNTLYNYKLVGFNKLSGDLTDYNKLISHGNSIKELISKEYPNFFQDLYSSHFSKHSSLSIAIDHFKANIIAILISIIFFDKLTAQCKSMSDDKTITITGDNYYDNYHYNEVISTLSLRGIVRTLGMSRPATDDSNRCVDTTLMFNSGSTYAVIGFELVKLEVKEVPDLNNLNFYVAGWIVNKALAPNVLTSNIKDILKFKKLINDLFN